MSDKKEKKELTEDEIVDNLTNNFEETKSPMADETIFVTSANNQEDENGSKESNERKENKENQIKDGLEPSKNSEDSKSAEKEDSIIKDIISDIELKNKEKTNTNKSIDNLDSRKKDNYEKRQDVEAIKTNNKYTEQNIIGTNSDLSKVIPQIDESAEKPINESDFKTKEADKKQKEKAFTSEGIKSCGTIVLILIAIILILVGIFTLMTAMPSMTLEKLKSIVQDMWNGVNGRLTGIDQTDVNEKNIIKAAQYLYDMGYDLEGCGFAENIEFEKDSNGNPNGKVKSVKNSYLMSYFVAEEKTFLIRDGSVNLKSVFSGVTTGKIIDSIRSWGSGLINLEDGIGNASIDRINNILMVNANGSSYYFNMAGWGGRYGKPFELLLTLHLATMAPDFAYEIAFNPDLDTKVNIGVKNGARIKTVTNHWFRNIYFDTEGRSVEYGVIRKNKDDKRTIDERLSDRKKSEKDKNDATQDIEYEYTNGNRKLKTKSGSINVYENGESAETYEGKENSGLDQEADGVRGATNPTTKKLFKSKYYIYDGSTKTAENIRTGKVAKKEINPNNMSLQAFSILENETSIDSQVVYRDLKELLVELKYFDYNDYKKPTKKILEWPIPDYKNFIWPVSKYEKQVLDYGTLILSKTSVDRIKEEEGLSSIKGVRDDGESGMSKTYGKADFTPETRGIVNRHKFDFDIDNFVSKMSSYGGYEAYVKSLGGVFTKYAGKSNIADVHTYDELQDVSEYVFGIMTIYGFDYSNGKPEKYGIWGKTNSAVYPDGFYKGRTNGNPYNAGSPSNNIDVRCSPENGLQNMVTCCNVSVDLVYHKAGLFSNTDPSKPRESSNASHLMSHGGQVISKVEELEPGDIIECYHSPVPDQADYTTWGSSGWYHVCFVGEKDEVSGTLTLYDGGSFFTNSGNFKNVVKISNPGWPLSKSDGWGAIRVTQLGDTLIGFEEGLDVIAMGDGKVIELIESKEYGKGIKIELTGNTMLKGYGLIMAGFDVSVKEGATVKAGDIVGTTTKSDIVLILIDLEKAYVENIENYVKRPEKKVRCSTDYRQLIS